jgi:hypothetical protein
MGLSLPASLSLRPAEHLFGSLDVLNLESQERTVLLPFTAQVQEYTNWCWSAVATSVGLFYGSGNWTQCAIVTEQVNSILFPGEHNDCCSTPESSHCNVDGILFFSLQQVRSLDHWESKKPSADTLFAILSGKRELVCLRIEWTDGRGKAHFTTICGSTDPADGADVMVTVSETIRDADRTWTGRYSDLPLRYLGGGKWTDTFFTRGRFGPGAECGTADSAAVAIDNQCNCVALRVQQGKLFSRVGKVDPINKTLTWGSDTLIDTGASGAVSLDNDANCVEVHANGGKLFYRLAGADRVRDW